MDLSPPPLFRSSGHRANTNTNTTHLTLRGETDMTHDGDPHIDEPLYEGCRVSAALDFDGLHPALFDETDGVCDSELHRGLVRAKGHVRHEQGQPRAPRDAPAVVEHLVHPDLVRVGVPARDHRQAVPDEQDVGLPLLDEARGRVVVRGDDRDRDPGRVHLLERAEGHFLPRTGGFARRRRRRWRGRRRCHIAVDEWLWIG